VSQSTKQAGVRPFSALYCLDVAEWFTDRGDKGSHNQLTVSSLQLLRCPTTLKHPGCNKFAERSVSPSLKTGFISVSEEAVGSPESTTIFKCWLQVLSVGFKKL
jgi:hypothetical protein